MTELKRFFVALLPPPDMQDYANQVRQYFADHYNSRKAFNSPPHITLQPPFNWARDRREQLVTELTQFAQTQVALPITLQGFGAFPPRVIFIRVVQSPALLALQTALSQYCAADLAIRQPAPGRAFVPHLTVAFRDLAKHQFERAWPQFAHQALALTNTAAAEYQFMAQSLTLLQHDGHCWQMDTLIPLGGVD